MSLFKLICALTLGMIPVISEAQRSNAASTYKVIGNIKGLSEGTKMYLIDGGKRKVIDSATVRSGQFVIDGSLAETAHMYLHAGKGSSSRKLADILLDNRTIYVKGNKAEYDSVVVSGSDIDQQWKDWFKEDQQIGYQRFQVRKVYEALLSKNDTINANALKKVVGEMQSYRVNLLKAYVMRYHDTGGGAALPTLCTLGDYLTKADYLEMYNMLSPTWQKSYFGREILDEASRKTNTPKVNK
ncbi:DUF4369 domain-containing protein [Spirosoma utsteinense]|uniref:DUF4369 domain-containing protein n=1 Tax=Spirosoma utsteinense TaxID=2585773 RepID=A0ABR6WEE7_9BACT|nr:DUF4369 domain-containing protein [Spirosoma utsteinense]MBC3787995.1 hypothetical protein [Spirosoma utsteinense]MBC3794928.1 hypothetical protein [Spirosoma utsteinense]